MDRVILLLHNAVASEKHLTRHIARGLSKMLASFKISMQGHSSITPQDGPKHGLTTPISQNSYQAVVTNLAVEHQPNVKSGFNGVDSSIVDEFGFSFNESWQDFPATTLDFLTSEWQDSGFN